MRKLLIFISLLITFNIYSQTPETSDSIYWSGNYCDTAETIEEALNQWIWNDEIKDCTQPDPNMLNDLWLALWLTDEYECCCEVASLPGSNAAMTGFWESDCQDYLDDINFDYMSIDSNVVNKLNGIYIDIYGRKYNNQPNGLSIMNNKKYYKF